MDEEYKKIKSQYIDEIVFYQVGQFFQAYYYDAVLVSQELGLQLNKRTMGGGIIAPVCGVPLNALNNKVEILNLKSYKVVVCKQYKDVINGKQIVKRDDIECFEVPNTLTKISLKDVYTEYMNTYSYNEAKAQYDAENKIKSNAAQELKKLNNMIIPQTDQSSVSGSCTLASRKENVQESSDLQVEVNVKSSGEMILEELYHARIENMTPMDCILLLNKWKGMIVT